MKIIFVSANYEHTNSMHSNNVFALKEYAEIDFWGPGYVDVDQLEKGIQYRLKNVNYDALILDFTFALYKSEERNFAYDYWMNRYLIPYYSVFQAERYVDEIIEQCIEYDGIKLLLYNHDSTSFLESWRNQAQLLIDNGFYFIGQGIELVPDVAWSEKSGTIVKRYRDFITQNETVNISYFFQTVVYSEFFAKPLVEREYDITVPGNLDLNLYVPRAIIAQKIALSGYKVNNNYKKRNIVYRQNSSRCDDSVYLREDDRKVDEQLADNCVFLNARVSRENIMMWRFLYDEVLRSTKIAYVDGGLGEQIVRKFCEIPARGMLMLCQDIPTLGAYGLKDGENMIIVNENNILEVCEHMLSNPVEMQRIADNGQKMVFEKHTASKHAKTIIDSINRIKAGTFIGSHWENGNFIFDE